MDVAELRKRILRSIEDARKEAAVRRVRVDEARAAYDRFLQDIAVPMLRQTSSILKAAGLLYDVETPAETARLVAEQSPHTFLEIELDVTRSLPEVVARLSLTRGRQGHVIEERPIARDRQVGSLTEDDLAAFLVTTIPKLVIKS